MQVQITNLGVAALTAGGGAPVQLTLCKFGSASGYIPSLTDTDIHGTELFQVAPSGPTAVNGNTVQYSAYLDYSVGDFDWGEFGLFMSNGELFALGCGDTLVAKIRQTSLLTGNSIRLDVYLNMVGTNYEMWLDLANTNNNFRVATIQGIDYLPTSANAVPNIYIVQSSEPTQTSFQAYTDRQGLWNFDAYAYSTTAALPLTVVSATNTSVSISLASYNSTMAPNYLGERIIQFNSGNLYSICRNVLSIAVGGSTATINFATPLAIVPQVGSTFFYYNRDPYTTTNVSVPPATTTSLGLVQIGAGVSVTVAPPDAVAGIISVDRDTIPDGVVFSINTLQGDVTLTAADIPGTVRSVNGAVPDANGNVTIPSGYTLPIATQTTLGGVKASATVTVAADGTLGLGFTPVTSVNGQGGAVTIVGIINPTAIANAANLNTLTTSGIYFAATDAIAQSVTNGPTPTSSTRLSATLEVIPLTTGGSGGDVFQRWTQHGYSAERRLTGATWSGWTAIGGTFNTIATTSQLGLVQVGAGLGITAGGILSANVQTVNGVGPVGGDVTLTAANIGAVGLDQIGAENGVAGPLTQDPVDPPVDPNVSDYTYGRMPAEQLPLGGLYAAGEWNASTNSGTYTESSVNGTITHTVVLQNLGMMSDTWDFGSGNVTAVVPANGKIFRVTTAGSTALDGISSWSVGDLILAFGSLWVKVGNPSPEQVVSANLTVAAGATQTVTIPAGYNALTSLFFLKVRDASVTTTWYDAFAVATTTYTATTITFTNNDSVSRIFQYVLRK